MTADHRPLAATDAIRGGQPLPVLFVDHAPALGGAEMFLLSLFETLDRQRFVPQLATQSGQLAEAAKARNVTVHEVPLFRLRRTVAAPVRLARGVAALRRIILTERIAVVHANTVRASVYAACAARLTRRPLLWQVQDILRPGLYLRCLDALADAIVAGSRAIVAKLPEGKKIHIIPLGVQIPQFARDRRVQAQQLRDRWGVPRGAILIGHVARLQPWKGQRDVIAAAERLRDVPGLCVAIIGGDIFADAGAYEREIRAAVRARGLDGRVLFTGHQDDVPTVLQAVDVLVHASDNEPFGRVLIEAGASALPIVAYDGGATHEILTHDRSGLLVPTGDREALAAALRRVATDSALRRRLGDTARADISQRFAVEPLTRALEDVLQTTLAGTTRC